MYMLFFWRSHSSVPGPLRSPLFGPSLIVNGLLCILFGLAILAAPELLAYIVAAFLLFVGTSLLIAGWKMR